jgi:hypothetical protein
MREEPYEITDTEVAWRLISWTILIAMVLMTIWPFDLSPEDPLATGVGRIEAYGVLAATFLFGFPNRVIFAIAWPIALALADELLPVFFLEHRIVMASAFWKALGICLGVAVGLLGTKGRRIAD